MFWVTLSFLIIVNFFIIHDEIKKEKLNDEFFLVDKPSWLVQVAEGNHFERWGIKDGKI